MSRTRILASPITLFPLVYNLTVILKTNLVVYMCTGCSKIHGMSENKVFIFMYELIKILKEIFFIVDV